MIPLMIRNAMQGKPLPVYGDGLQIRDWIQVVDHCRGIWAAFTNGRAGEVYNLGGNSERTNLEVVRGILSILGQPESLIQYVKDRPGHDRRYAIDNSKSRRELGWAPLTTTFEQGLEETVAWYKSNQAWLDLVTSGEYQHYYEKMYAGR